MKPATLWFVAVLFATCASAQTDNAAQRRATAEAFGKEITRAFNERDRKALNSLIDLHALALRAARYQELSTRDEQAFVRGAETKGLEPLIATYFRALDTSQGSVKFVRVTTQTPPRSLVRFDLGDQGFNYAEYVLHTDATGRTRAVDWFQLTTGDLMSITLGGVGQIFTSANANMLERLFGGEKIDRSVIANLTRVGELYRTGKYAEALTILKNMPEPLASSRFILSARATAASYANLTDEYDAALAKMAAHHADDPAATFMLIDYHFKRQDTPKVLKSLDTMERRVGVDGVTRMLRSNAYTLTNDLANALKYADEAVALEPDLLLAQDTRATLLVRLARFKEAVAAYRDMETRFGIQFTREIFTADPTFEPLVASAPFKAWLPK
jgi:tetratricopeptide (TPR) repeat protein